jgi:acetyltransferase-like isoleucine patch superfamily enzyme
MNKIMGLISSCHPSVITKIGNRIRWKALQRKGIVSVGTGTYGDPIVYWWNLETHLSIGKFSSIADEVVFILGGEHSTQSKSTFPFTSFPKQWKNTNFDSGQPISKGDINIGNDVWIGYRATILSGVSIGDGAVIGAGSVISKNVAPYSIVAGNPAKVIGMRFTKSQIKSLLKEAWWEWPIEKINAHIPSLVRAPD